MDGVKKPPRDRSLHLSVEPSQARMAPRRSESVRSVAGAMVLPSVALPTVVPLTVGCSTGSTFPRLAFPRFRVTRSARSSHASAMRTSRVLSAGTPVRFAKSRYAVANRRYSKSELISGPTPLREKSEKPPIESRKTSKDMCGSAGRQHIGFARREKFSPGLS